MYFAFLYKTMAVLTRAEIIEIINTTTPGKVADLRGVNLDGLDLSGLEIKKLGLDRASLENTNLSNANLREALISMANLCSAY